MKRQREELKWPSNEELVQLICDPVGEVTNESGKITAQHRCPHPYCNHKSGNIIGRQKGRNYNSVVTHLKVCIGRHGNIETLYNLYHEIKENPHHRTEILDRFRAETIARMKPSSGEIVENNQKRLKRYHLLSESELQDMNSSLEHICMFGAKNRQDENRRRLFETTHKQLLETEHRLPLDAPPVNPFGPPTHPDNNLFAEDIRLYGQHETTVFREIPDSASSMKAWPRRDTTKCRPTVKGRKYDDNAWNAEHGDTINTLAFTMARLSQKTPSAEDQELMNGTNLLIDTTDVGLYETQVPQALLQRCWERAVHASSCVTFASTGVPEESTISSPIGATNGNDVAPRQSLYNTVQERAARSKKESMEKMKALGMKNYFKNAVRVYNLKCPICSRQFDNREQLEACFFGGMEAASNNSETGFRGCCWNLIKEKQHSLIESALDTHVKTQVTGILGIIMKAAEEKMPTQQGEDKMRLFNWYDVLKFVEESLASSQTFSDSKKQKSATSVLETLEVKSGSTPIFLNPSILETVRKRLIDRYADVPY